MTDEERVLEPEIEAEQYQPEIADEPVVSDEEVVQEQRALQERYEKESAALENKKQLAIVQLLEKRKAGRDQYAEFDKDISGRLATLGYAESNGMGVRDERGNPEVAISDHRSAAQPNTQPKGKRGRPPGAKNKAKLEASSVTDAAPKKKRGRPPKKK